MPLLNATSVFVWRLAVLLAVLAAADVAVVRGQESSEGEQVDEDDSLASVPDMYGDFFARDRFSYDSDNLSSVGFSNFPQRGRVKIGENNSPFPKDRFYFMVQHYGNAIESNLQPTPGGILKSQSRSLNRYTLGVEKTWLGGVWSTEIRMPLFTGGDTVYDTDVFTHNGNAGNLSVIIKRLFFQSETAAASAGLGLSLPTGSDTEFDLGDELYKVENQAVHLQPFVAYLRAEDRLFFQGFIQLDIPSDGNSVTARLAGFSTQRFGKLTDQTYLFVDASTGYWLYRNRSALVLTGLAAVAELHYTASLTGGDAVNGLTVSNTAFTVKPSRNSLHAMTLTSGVHLELTQRTSLRVAAVVPLVDEAVRPFDSEIWASLNCRF